MSTITNIIARAKKDRKARSIIHDMEQRLRMIGVNIDKLYDADELEELRDLGINGGRESVRDSNGFTPKQICWADVYELYHRYAAETNDEEARAKVIVEKRLGKKGQILDKVIRRGREDVNAVLRHRGLIP